MAFKEVADAISGGVAAELKHALISAIGSISNMPQICVQERVAGVTVTGAKSGVGSGG